MELFIAWRSTADVEIERATRQNEPEMARRASTGIDSGNMLLQSWVLQASGEMIVTSGIEGQAKVPAEKLDELPDVLERYENATDSRISVGVGFETHEAETALKVAEVAEARGGKPSIVLYSEGVAQEAHELEESKKDEELGPILPEDEAALEDEAPESDGGEEPTLHKAEGDAKPGEASKVAAGTIKPDAAMPSAPSPISPASPISPGQGAAPAPGQPQDPQQLKQSVVSVLQDVKTNMAAIQQLQQTDPAAFQSVIGLIQAFVAVAQQAFGGQPMQKTEGEGTFQEQVAEESSEHPSFPKEDIEQIVEDHMEKGDGPMHPMTPGKRHVVDLPVGSTLDTGPDGTRNAGKVKVRHSDGKTGYVSVRAGQIMSQDGHPVSSRNPGGR